jgi:hypothetical protein
MSLSARRGWFDEHLAAIKEAAPEALAALRFTCPCCGYPTLPERSAYDICPLCWWEDDGQDETDQAVVRGGSNQDFSLSEARANFDRYALMYPPDRDRRVSGGDSAAAIAAKHRAINAFDAMLVPGADLTSLWHEVDTALKALRHELHVSLSRHRGRK